MLIKLHSQATTTPKVRAALLQKSADGQATPFPGHTYGHLEKLQ
ncbi:hypothetical protein [Marivita cryptomonadis]|jgi:hypothetical protein|nr:hypothetical protein [Marivita cryptomonadis]